MFSFFPQWFLTCGTSSMITAEKKEKSHTFNMKSIHSHTVVYHNMKPIFTPGVLDWPYSNSPLQIKCESVSILLVKWTSYCT